MDAKEIHADMTEHGLSVFRPGKFNPSDEYEVLLIQGTPDEIREAVKRIARAAGLTVSEHQGEE